MEEFLRKRFGQSRKAATRVAEQLMSRVFYPRVVRALFGIDPISGQWRMEKLSMCSSTRRRSARSSRRWARGPDSFVSVIEDTICISHIKCRNQTKEELSRSKSPICNLALVAFPLARRVMHHEDRG